MGVFVAKQGVIMSHWGTVGVIARSVGLNGGSSELSRAQWGLRGGQWESVRNLYTPIYKLWPYCQEIII